MYCYGKLDVMGKASSLKKIVRNASIFYFKLTSAILAPDVEL